MLSKIWPTVACQFPPLLRFCPQHCAGDQHRAAVAADPSYAVLLELESWTGSDGECRAQTAAHGRSRVAAEEEATTVPSSSSAAAAAAAAAGAGAAGAGAAGVGAGRGGDVTSTGETGVASAANERDEGRDRSPARAGKGETFFRGRDDAKKPEAPTGRESPSRRRRGVVSSPTRCDATSGGVVDAKREASTTKGGSALRDTVSPSGLRDALGARTGERVLRNSPRRYPKPGHQATLAPCSGGGACAPPKAPPSVEPPRPGSLHGRKSGVSCGSGDAVPSRGVARKAKTASKGEDCASSGLVTGTPPQPSTASVRSTRSSPLPCNSSKLGDECGTTVLDGDASGLRKDTGGLGSPAAASADTPATSVVSNPSSQTDCSERSRSSSEKAWCPSESPACTRARGRAFSPSSSRRFSPRRVGIPGRSCKEDTAVGPRSGTASPAAGAEAVQRYSRASHGASIEACRSPTVSGGFGSSPSGQRRRADSVGTAAQKQQPTRSVPRDAGEKPEHVSAPSPLSDDQKRDETARTEKRRKRELRLLEDSPEFRLGGPSPAGSTSRVRTCDARGRNVTTSESGGRRCSRDHHPHGDGPATKLGGGKVRRTDDRSATSDGSGNEEWRVKRKRKTRHKDEGGGSPPTDNGSSRESGACSHACRYPAKSADTMGLVGGTTEEDTERAGDGSGSSAAVVPREEEGPKRAGLPVGSRGDTDTRSTRSRGGTRSRSKRRTPSTAGRMGLETTGDSSDDGGGSCAEDAGQQSSPLSPEWNERNRDVPRSLGSRFAEDCDGRTARAARGKHAAVGANSDSEPPAKRARAPLSRSPGLTRA